MMDFSRLDREFVWHPFTQMREWIGREPIVIVSGRGATLRDHRGREYLDANASIWTNLHGHRHPALDRALRRQLGKVAHVSALGLANEPAAGLAERLVTMASAGGRAGEEPELSRVFYSDDGSTAVEVALKLAYEVGRRTGRSPRPRFLSLQGAYHGDTVGAVSLGHIDRFHRAYRGLLFRSDAVMAPYCYRCPYNRAKPERLDARDYRKCQWECLGMVERRFEQQGRKGRGYAAFVFEPLIQGAAGMIPQPPGWLRQVTDLARSHGALLVADEVMTGFGRTGTGNLAPPGKGLGRADRETNHATAQSEMGAQAGMTGRLLACHAEGVRPDFLCLAKGLTGGYLPMAATLTTSQVFGEFLGRYEDFKTFFHGHSYSGNPLGAAVALASLELLESARSLRARTRVETMLREELRSLWKMPQVGDIRQVGLVVGIELVRDWRTREPFPVGLRAGTRVCEAMARRGVLTRPVGDVVVLMPPYCMTTAQVRRMVASVRDAVRSSLCRSS
jgi:adenosylmethionine---8-amino-7-oxononanoate aminotransferase